jgi:PKD repeat protein
MARVTVDPLDKTISTFKSFSAAGNYTITVSASNPMLNGNTVTNTTTIMILEGITGLSFKPRNGYCQLNAVCYLDSSVKTGSNINYYWSFANVTLNTTSTTITYTFTQNGYFTVNLLAVNQVSQRFATVNVLVSDRLDGLQFYSGVSVQSASIIGQNAQFLFILVSGSGYSCNVDFGDGSAMLTFGDQPYNLNNTLIQHSYATAEAKYKVNIVCWNSINNLTLSFDHYTQFALTGLSLVKTGTTLNTPYSIDFMLTSGSTPYYLEFLLNNQLDSSVTPLSKVAGSVSPQIIYKGTSKNGETISILYYVRIKLVNYVSSIELNTTFDISSPIVSPTFDLSPTSDAAILAIDPSLTHTYKFSYNLNQISFKISMQSGSNIKLSIFTGDEADPAQPSIQASTIGDWNNNLNNVQYGTMAHIYLTPGDYKITVNISNSLNYVSFTKSITIISPVDDLIPGLAQAPIIFKSVSGGVGLAELVFASYGLSKAGSHSKVSFWPGDAQNSTYGPFSLSMDFGLNASTVSLSYSYKSIGTYYCSFWVGNLLGAKAFRLAVNVVKGIDGFYIDVDPKFALVNQNVNVAAYMIYGDGVTLGFYQNGALLNTKARTCK